MRAESLKVITTESVFENLPKQLFPTGGQSGWSVAPEAHGAEPRNQEHYKTIIRTMGLAWVAQSLRHKDVPYFKHLMLETFTTWGEYVCGPCVAGLTRQSDGARPPWQAILKCEFAVRTSWWELVETGLTLNDAILKSIGADPMHTPSGLWNTMVALPLSLAARSFDNKRTGDQHFDLPGPKARRVDAGRVGKSKGGSGPNGAKGGKDGGHKRFQSQHPARFQGKLSKCQHNKRICFDHHSEAGCPLAARCRYCHACCPEPGCNISCEDGSHTLLSH